MIRTLLALPNGQVVTLDETRHVVVSDPMTGAVAHRYALENVQNIALSVDQTLVLTHQGSELTAWDWKTSKLAFQMDIGKEDITALAYAEKTQILAVSYGEQQTVYEMTNRRKLYDLNSESSDVDAMLLTSDGKTLVTGYRGGPHSDQVWWRDAKTGQKTRTLELNIGVITALTLTSDERWLLVGGWGVGLVEMKTGRIEQQYPMEETVNSISWNELEQQFVTANNDRFIRVQSIKNNAPVVSWSASRWLMRGAAWLPNGQIVTASGDGAIRVWKAPNQEQSSYMLVNGPVWEVVVNPHGEDLITAARDGAIRRWSLSGALLGTWSIPDYRLSDLSWSPNGQIFAASSDHPKNPVEEVYLFDVHQSDPITVLKVVGTEDSDTGIFGTAFSPNGEMLAVACYGYNGVQLFNLLTKKPLGFLKHDDDVFDVHFSPDGKRIIASEYKKVNIWQVANQKLERTIEGLRAAQVTPDNLGLIGIDYENRQPVRIRFESKTTQTIQPAPVSVSRIVISENGQYMVSGNSDNSLTMWDLTTGKVLFTQTISAPSEYEISELHPQFLPNQSGLVIGAGAEVGLLFAPFSIK